MLVAAIETAGMAVAYPVGIGLALIIGVIVKYVRNEKAVVGIPVGFRDYFAGRPGSHLTGVVGGVIWGVSMSFNLIAAGRAGFAISYAHGQGATMIAAFWGVFIWKEFRISPPGTSILLAAMFASFLAGLTLIVLARTVQPAGWAALAADDGECRR